MRRVAANLLEIFKIDVAQPRLHEFKFYAEEYYQPTFDKILKKILTGDLIIADETKINLKDASGYVWVFTNTEEVIYLYKDTREGDFLQDLLKGFNGVLVSDFFPAYDSINCPQQKCLIHLIRDFNDDLQNNPFDEEFKSIARPFTTLLKTIIDTVDKYGLKKRNLQKHNDDVDRFYKKIEESEYSSEAAKKYQTRLMKNRDKLFTFLNYDGIPWNNNDVEHAIKHLVRIRKKGIPSFKRSRINGYMLLISIYQTCQYKGISFLKFLLSREKNIDEYMNKKTMREII